MLSVITEPKNQNNEQHQFWKYANSASVSMTGGFLLFSSKTMLNYLLSFPEMFV